MKKALFLLIVMCSFGGLASAQKDWQTKNFEQWTKADVEEILTCRQERDNRRCQAL